MLVDKLLGKNNKSNVTYKCEYVNVTQLFLKEKVGSAIKNINFLLCGSHTFMNFFKPFYDIYILIYVYKYNFSNNNNSLLDALRSEKKSKLLTVETSLHVECFDIVETVF